MAKNMVVDKKMLERLTWKSTFADLISKLVDFQITKENIHSDENGWDYFVTSKSLLPNCPILLVHHSGPLTAIIPYKDYMQLENGEIYPLAYIANAHWSYGKYSGGDNVSTGVFWKPLEKREGICDTKMISQYLHQQTSVTIDPEDYRQQLFKAVENRIREELELEVGGFMSYNGENALLIPGERDIVTCYLPAILLNDILYHPGEREWEEFANGFKFELGVNNSRRRYIIKDTDERNHAELCRKVWRSFGIVNCWHAKEQSEILKEETKSHPRQTHPQEHQAPKLTQHKNQGFTITGFMKKVFPKR